MINKIIYFVALTHLLLSCGESGKAPRIQPSTATDKPTSQTSDSLDNSSSAPIDPIKKKDEVVPTKVDSPTGPFTEKFTISAAAKIQLPVDFVVIPDGLFEYDAANGPIVTAAASLPEDVRKMTELLRSSGVPSYQGWVFGSGPGYGDPLSYQSIPHVQVGGNAAPLPGVNQKSDQTILKKAIGLVKQTDKDTLTVKFRHQSIKAFIFLSRFALQSTVPSVNNAQIQEFVDLLDKDSTVGNNRSMVFGFTRTNQFACPAGPGSTFPPIDPYFANLANNWGGAAYEYCPPGTYRWAMMDIGQKIAERVAISREFRLTKKPANPGTIEVKCVGSNILSNTRYFYDAERNSLIFPKSLQTGPKGCESDTIEVVYQ